MSRSVHRTKRSEPAFSSRRLDCFVRHQWGTPIAREKMQDVASQVPVRETQAAKISHLRVQQILVLYKIGADKSPIAQ